MNEDQGRQNNLIDTTDYLEAVGVFRGWKNFLFVIVILCLLLLQGSFWLVNTGYVKAEDKACAAAPVVAAEPEEQTAEAAKQIAGVSEEIEKAAKQVTAAPNQPAQAAPEPEKKKPRLSFTITFKQLALLIRFVNFVLVPVAVLYCLTMLFGLKVSMVGRLGGINHISRAFFISLVFVVFLLPWQIFFGGVVAGAMYTPDKLLDSYTAFGSASLFGKVFYYLRFTGYWVLVVLLLIFSQLRSLRWAKAMLRRLEVI